MRRDPVASGDAWPWTRLAPADARPAGAGEALVVARDEVGLDLLHGVERHADHDQEAGAAEVERHVELRCSSDGSTQTAER